MSGRRARKRERNVAKARGHRANTSKKQVRIFHSKIVLKKTSLAHVEFMFGKIRETNDRVLCQRGVHISM